jgi:hypothetical protein
MHTEFQPQALKGKYYMESLGAYGKIILNES